MNQHVITQDDLEGILIDGNKLCITHARTHVASVKAIVRIMERVIRSRSTLFACRGAGAFSWPHETKIGKELRSCIKFDTWEIERHFPKHRFHPLYVLFKRYFAPFYGEVGWATEEVVGELNAAVAKVRAWGKGEGLKRRLDNMRRTERANWSRVRKLLREQREAYSKSLAIRLDVGYVSTHKDGSFQALGVSYSEAAGHRAQLVGYLRNGPFKDVLTAYVWKTEYGMEKGFHHHIAVVMDGQRVCKDINIAAAIGEHWRSVITSGRGGYFNCNQKKEAYVRCGLGNLARGDDEMWSNLEEALRYLTKADLFIRMKVPPKARTFGVGGVYKA